MNKDYWLIAVRTKDNYNLPALILSAKTDETAILEGEEYASTHFSAGWKWMVVKQVSEIKTTT